MLLSVQWVVIHFSLKKSLITLLTGNVNRTTSMLSRFGPWVAYCFLIAAHTNMHAWYLLLEVLGLHRKPYNLLYLLPSLHLKTKQRVYFPENSNLSHPWYQCVFLRPSIQASNIDLKWRSTFTGSSSKIRFAVILLSSETRKNTPRRGWSLDAATRL